MSFSAESLVVATGGLSIPKMGATGFGYDLARQFGLKIVEPPASAGAVYLESKTTRRISAIWPESRPKSSRRLARRAFAKRC